MESDEWLAHCRQSSEAVRALQERDRKLKEILDCDDCQEPEYDPCAKHREDR